MLDENQEITMSGESLIEVLAEIEFILISLHRMGSYYVGKPVEDYRRATTDFIDNRKVTHKLAKIRTILSHNFDGTRGDDDMDDIERGMLNIKFWKPGDL